MTRNLQSQIPQRREIIHSINELQDNNNSLALRELDGESTQVLDDLPPILPVNYDTIERDDPPNKIIRKIAAASLTWNAISKFIQHNYLEAWIPRLSNYVNKLTMINEEIWDRQQPDDA